MNITTTRRDFLRVGAATGGALLLEFALPGCGPSGVHAVQPTARPGDFVPNAWLRITPDDHVVFTLDRVEMGQGTMTSHAQLVAEELAIDPAMLVVELAVADRAYDNPDPQIGMQLTGGSTSVKTSYIPLRKAAATAREMLRAAAARRWNVASETCSAEGGAIVHGGSGRRARYGELAADAAKETVPSAPSLKQPSEFRVIGQPVARLDSRAKVDGSAIYGIDVSLEGMVNAVVVRPPTVGAELVRFNATAARGQPGVIDVFAIPQGVAIVAAKYWQARRAASLVRIEWTAGNTWIDSTSLRKSYLERASRPATSVRSEGDIEKAERGAAKVLEAIYELPYLAHAPLEPQNATASIKNGRCEIWAPTQAPALAREAARRITGFSYDAITLHQTLVGGGFGRRLDQDYVEEAVQIALRVPHPVKLLFSREDEMRHSQYRPMVVSAMRGAIARDGSIVSWLHRIVAQSIIAQTPPYYAALLPNAVPLALKSATVGAVRALGGGNGVTDPTSVEGANTVAYGIPNLRVEYAPIVHPVRVGPWRSVGCSHTVFAVESFLDELAHAAGKDPFLVRRELLAKAPRERGVLELAAEKIGWGRPPPAGRARGIAQAKAFNSYCAHAAEVSVHGSDVRVHRIVSAVDIGMVVNPQLVEAQVQSAIVFGLSAALRQEITLRAGAVEQGNFNDYEPLRLHEMPEVEVHIVPSKEAPTGIGEPGVPPIAPAVANAVFQATGRRIRVLPFSRGFTDGEPSK